MPLYEYLCDACGERFDLIQKFTDPAPDVCPKCGKGPVERQQSSPAIQFKGSGFYITDYARKGPTSSGDAGGKSSPESASAGESGGDSKKTDSRETDSKKTESRETESKKTESKKTEAAPASTTGSSTTDKS